MTSSSTEVRPCPPGLRRAALQLLYQRVPDSLRARLVEDVLREVQSEFIDLSGLWIATERLSKFWPDRHRRQITGALLTQRLAGRAAAVWAPETGPSLRREATALALVRAALEDLRSRGVRIVQSVLDESASRQGALDLARGGLPKVTELLYLERDTRLPLAVPPPGPGGPPPIEWRPFRPAHEREFRELLQATYISSLDMPELEGVRSLDDIIQGHQAAGRFAPEFWQFGRVPGLDGSGIVLLLSDIPDRDTWEVVYLGLTPPTRGRGLGRAALARAVELARSHTRRIELAVDTRNHPATRLYASTGFRVYDRRAVHLVVFREPSDRAGG
ncbi:MAG: GNAT family N-acetyltransferase [Isosphaeraceae bacterium]